MIEVPGNLWKAPADCDALVITTNGMVKKDGRCVMGRGIAQQARDMFPGIDFELGQAIKHEGNHVYPLIYHDLYPRITIVSFPVKHHWKQRADLQLIERSAKELRRLADDKYWGKVGLVRPGCGNGQLDWETVRPLLVRHLDDRFYVVQSKEL